MRLAENLSKLKTASGYTIPELARYLGVSAPTVRRIISHRSSPNSAYNPTYNTVRTIANKLKTTTDNLYKYRLEMVSDS